MNIRDWWTFYSEIVADFSYDSSMDFISSLKLSAILGSTHSQSNFKDIKGKDVMVVGNGPDMNELLGSMKNGIHIVADSAIDSYFPEKGCPDYIVTDLDGNIARIMGCASEGTTLAVHSHGDNIEKIEKFSPSDSMKVCGTTQNIPLWNVSNYGGFTDGDRAAYIADVFGARAITLVGFDFNNPNPAKDSDRSIKRKKLQWAKKLLENLAHARGSELTEGDFIEI